MEKKSKSMLKVLTILSWLIFFSLCVIVSEFETNKNLELAVSIFAIASFVAAIVLSILLGKNKTKNDTNKIKEISLDLFIRKLYF